MKHIVDVGVAALAVMAALNLAFYAFHDPLFWGVFQGFLFLGLAAVYGTVRLEDER